VECVFFNQEFEMRNAMGLLAMVFFMGGIQAQDAAKVLKELEGTYELKSLMVGGKPAAEEMTKELKGIEIKGGELVIKLGARDDTAKMSIDPTKKPATIDLTPKNDKGEARLGIYKVEKGELTIVFARKGDRPTSFEGKGEDEMKMVIAKKK